MEKNDDLTVALNEELRKLEHLTNSNLTEDLIRKEESPPKEMSLSLALPEGAENMSMDEEVWAAGLSEEYKAKLQELIDQVGEVGVLADG